MRPSREKDQSYLRNFMKFHEYKDILVDSVAINRWATKAVTQTLPGIVSSLLLNHYRYLLQDARGMEDISQFGQLQTAIREERITADEIKEHVYGIYQCSDHHGAVGTLYRQTIDRSVDSLFEALRNGAFDRKLYITQAFESCYFKVMLSLRDTDKQLIVAME